MEVEEVLLAAAGLKERIFHRRDIVFVDQRGTGDSNRLGCDPAPDDLDEIASDDARTERRLKACLASYDADPRLYTTPIAMDDLVPTDLRYPDRLGEIYSLRFSPAHRWFYFSRMRPDEAMLLKCYDSDAARARFTAHSAFEDPTSAPDAPARESIEVRILAFFP